MILWLVDSPATIEQKHNLHGNSVTEEHKHEFLHVKPKGQIKMLDVFYAWNVISFKLVLKTWKVKQLLQER